MTWTTPQNKPLVYIGIDPGIKTGIAVWDSRKKTLERIETLPIHRAIELVKECYVKHGNGLKVRFEDARLWKHHKNTDNARLQGAGSVKRDCSMWEDFLTDLKVPFEGVKPNNKITKLDKDRFLLYTGYRGLTSSHGRDAALLVYGL